MAVYIVNRKGIAIVFPSAQAAEKKLGKEAWRQLLLGKNPNVRIEKVERN